MNRLDLARDALQMDDLDNLRQMLGMHRARSAWGHTNRMFVRTSDQLRMASATRLLGAGVITQYGSIGQDSLYAATRLGCELAGLPERRIQRALSTVS